MIHHQLAIQSLPRLNDPIVTLRSRSDVVTWVILEGLKIICPWILPAFCHYRGSSCSIRSSFILLKFIQWFWTVGKPDKDLAICMHLQVHEYRNNMFMQKWTMIWNHQSRIPFFNWLVNIMIIKSGRLKVTYPIVTSKRLLPTELDTAISPYPLRATRTLVIRSGMLVPAASTVSPMISSSISIVRDISFAHQTMK